MQGLVDCAVSGVANKGFQHTTPIFLRQANVFPDVNRDLQLFGHSGQMLLLFQ